MTSISGGTDADTLDDLQLTIRRPPGDCILAMKKKNEIHREMPLTAYHEFGKILAAIPKQSMQQGVEVDGLAQFKKTGKQDVRS